MARSALPSVVRGAACALLAIVAACAGGGHDGWNAEEWALVQTLSPLPALGGCPDDLDAAPPDDDCEAMARLGQALFCDPGYSGPLSEAQPGLGGKDEVGKVSCASCHIAGLWFADFPDRKVSIGASGATPRQAPSLVNVAFYPVFGWGGRFMSLSQVLVLPLGKPLNSSQALLYAHVNATPALVSQYQAVFGYPPSREDDVFRDCGRAIAAYERRLVSRAAPFDRYVAGDNDAISAPAKRGLRLFIGDALCIECHNGPHFSDDQLHDVGVHAEPGTTVDNGAFDNPDGGPHHGDEAFRGKFRTPSLRQVAGTPPYMHRGQLATLREVLEFYNRGPQPPLSPNLDGVLTPLALDDEQLADLEAFLRTLTGEPVAPPWNGCSP